MIGGIAAILPAPPEPPLIASALLLWTVGAARAETMALDPQNRAHVGVSVIPAPSGVGVIGGLDSRLTRVVALDIGGFASPAPLAEGLEGGEDFRETTLLRHGIYVTPGLRIPHAQPKTWAWEVFARGGGGVVWTANLSEDAPVTGDTRYAVEPELAGTLGADALVRFGRLGVRASGKAWLFEVLQPSPVEAFVVVRSQFGVEALLQW